MQKDTQSRHLSSSSALSLWALGKAECMKGMVDQLLNEGQKCHFILYNQRYPKKTNLQVHLENYFKKNKSKDNLVFSLNSDRYDGNSEEFYLVLKELSSQGTTPSLMSWRLWLTIAGIIKRTPDEFSLPYPTCGSYLETVNKLWLIFLGVKLK